jgi:hypothetical protein
MSATAAGPAAWPTQTASAIRNRPRPRPSAQLPRLAPRQLSDGAARRSPGSPTPSTGTTPTQRLGVDLGSGQHGHLPGCLLGRPRRPGHRGRPPQAGRAYAGGRHLCEPPVPEGALRDIGPVDRVNCRGRAVRRVAGDPRRRERGRQDPPVRQPRATPSGRISPPPSRIPDAPPVGAGGTSTARQHPDRRLPRGRLPRGRPARPGPGRRGPPSILASLVPLTPTRTFPAAGARPGGRTPSMAASCRRAEDRTTEVCA